VQAQIINVLQVTFTVCTKGGMKNLFWKTEWTGKPFLKHLNFCIL
jgi:hypothetical protein